MLIDDFEQEFGEEDYLMDACERYTNNSRNKGKEKAWGYDFSVQTPAARKNSRLGNMAIPRMSSVAGSSPASGK